MQDKILIFEMHKRIAILEYILKEAKISINELLLDSLILEAYPIVENDMQDILFYINQALEDKND